jgi:hypothetical protein
MYPLLQEGQSEWSGGGESNGNANGNNGVDFDGNVTRHKITMLNNIRRMFLL